MSALELSSDQLRELADLIADRLTARQAGEMIDATELAKRMGRSRDYVYEHAGALGAVRLGEGPRPRLMFPWPLRQVEGKAAVERPGVPQSRIRRKQTNTGLLPIKGQS
jgi:hypothetical protein